MLIAIVLLAGAAAGAFVTWRIARVRTRTELDAAREEMRREIRRWQDAADRARTEEDRVTREAAAQLAGWRQGRADVIAVMPYLYGRNGDTRAAADPGDRAD